MVARFCLLLHAAPSAFCRIPHPVFDAYIRQNPSVTGAVR
jgi:hypothetical protein